MSSILKVSASFISALRDILIILQYAVIGLRGRRCTVVHSVVHLYCLESLQRVRLDNVSPLEWEAWCKSERA